MEAVTLLQRAHEAGLHIELLGDTLLVRGPKRAEAVVKLLAEHKAEVLAALSPSCVDAGWWRERFTAMAVQWSFMARRGVRRSQWRLAGAKSSRWQ